MPSEEGKKLVLDKCSNYNEKQVSTVHLKLKTHASHREFDTIRVFRQKMCPNQSTNG